MYVYVILKQCIVYTGVAVHVLTTCLQMFSQSSAIKGSLNSL